MEIDLLSWPVRGFCSEPQRMGADSAGGKSRERSGERSGGAKSVATGRAA